jgi:hypothetical protein
MRPFLLPLLTLLAVLAWPTAARAADPVRSGEFVLHASAVPTTMLAPDVARRSGITRSANRWLVNVAVRRGPPGQDVAVTAKVGVAVTNLAGQRDVLRVREVREGDAIYYLAEARVAGRDTLAFEVEAQPAGGAAIRTMFRQEVFPP